MGRRYQPRDERQWERSFSFVWYGSMVRFSLFLGAYHFLIHRMIRSILGGHLFRAPNDPSLPVFESMMTLLSCPLVNLGEIKKKIREHRDASYHPHAEEVKMCPRVLHMPTSCAAHGTTATLSQHDSRPPSRCWLNQVSILETRPRDQLSGVGPHTQCRKTSQL